MAAKIAEQVRLLDGAHRDQAGGMMEASIAEVRKRGAVGDGCLPRLATIRASV
ncbi:MAG TPA: hypothetical protein VGU74_09135 [Gemmatimonadales bacterium]|nr:hypothetical protein [Gemmatimonadales bacterium]